MKMLHTCIRVMDLEKSIKFYTEVLGLEETRKKDHSDHGFVLVYLSDENKHYELELTYNIGQETSYEIGNGFSHTAVETSNLEEQHSRIKNLGYTVTDLKGLVGAPPNYFFVTDPDGYKVEIIRAK
ncbi:MAG: VOC family protein [Lachnospirales bacterium]